MSTPSNVYEGGAIEESQYFVFGVEIIYSATTFLAYSHLLSLGEEIECFWSSPRRPASFIFLIIRYLGLLSQLIQACLNSYTYDCNNVARLRNATFAIAMTATYAIQIIRTNAIWGGSHRFLPILLTAVCLPAVVCEVWEVISETCESPLPTALQVNGQMSSELAFESIVLAATVWRVVSLDRQTKKIKVSGESIAGQIMKSEIAYYCALILCDTGTIVSNNVHLLPPFPLIETHYSTSPLSLR